ncbi:hypothetical protein ABGB09_15195 [Streptomyces sp. B8F3]|uniref:hypothetical protein n=1 Tax=Streptomyces sp. B8F3 TaxID=3153573 RepID=UPI00325C394A
MPTGVLPALVGRRPVDEASRHDLWERAAHKGLRPGEAVGVVASRSIRLPHADSVVALPDSLDARRDRLPAACPAGPGDPVEAHLLTLLRGEGPAAARESICLNAAVAALAAGADRSLPEAFHAAEDALRDGAAVRLVERLHTRRVTEPARQVAGVRA